MKYIALIFKKCCIYTAIVIYIEWFLQGCEIFREQFCSSIRRQITLRYRENAKIKPYGRNDRFCSAISGIVKIVCVHVYNHNEISQTSSSHSYCTFYLDLISSMTYKFLIKEICPNWFCVWVTKIIYFYLILHNT